MQITAHSSARRYATVVDRVQLIAQPAMRLVEQAMGRPLGHASIVITDSRRLRDVVLDAETSALGERHKVEWISDGRRHGCTTLTSSGVVIVIDAEECQKWGNHTDVTVVHELVHGVQLSRPSDRADYLQGLRYNHGITPLSPAEVRAVNRRVDAREREAGRLERLARQLKETA
ncbi:hypothetical protein ABZT43_12270 [Streptomyces sp. NPDC005349]|uniref:hypothetical protein n=1 Tax=Streptomyces sp. NPDC005349 TaxID=3157037 RepID=UPI0033A32DC1